jgi:hypothetical protein
MGRYHFAIEEEQRKYIESRYPDAAEKKKIFVLGIRMMKTVPDQN